MHDADASVWCKELGVSSSPWMDSSFAGQLKRVLKLSKLTANEASLFVLCWSTMKARVLCWKLISFLKKIGSEESILPAILADEVYSMYPLFNWKPTLAQTLLCLSVKPSFNRLKLNLYQIQENC